MHAGVSLLIIIGILVLTAVLGNMIEAGATISTCCHHLDPTRESVSFDRRITSHRDNLCFVWGAQASTSKTSHPHLECLAHRELVVGEGRLVRVRLRSTGT